MFISEVINVNTDYFYFYLHVFYCTSKRSVSENLMVEIKTLESVVVYPYFLLRTKKRCTREMVFRKRIIIMGNEDDHEALVWTQFAMPAF